MGGWDTGLLCVTNGVGEQYTYLSEKNVMDKSPSTTLLALLRPAASPFASTSVGRGGGLTTKLIAGCNVPPKAEWTSTFTKMFKLLLFFFNGD